MIARLHIQVAQRGKKSFLTNVFYSQPFKLADITENKTDHTLRLMLMSSSPGVLDGDQYHVSIELEKGCSVELDTQSYQRLFTMNGGASQHWNLTMDEDSSFVFIPQPSVPHESSKFKSVNKLYLGKNCFLIWGEVITCGRKLNGEIFRFSSYHSITEIYLSGKLIIKENLLMTPGQTDLSLIGQLEGFTHQASFTCVLHATNTTEVIGRIYELLEKETNIEFGISALPGNAFIFRILGYKAEPLYHLLKKMARLTENLQANKEDVKQTAYAG